MVIGIVLLSEDQGLAVLPGLIFLFMVMYAPGGGRA